MPIFLFETSTKTKYKKARIRFLFTLCYGVLFLFSPSEILAAGDLRTVTEPHPRIWITGSTLDLLRQDCLPSNGGKNALWNNFYKALNVSWSEYTFFPGQALIYLILKDTDPVNANKVASLAISTAVKMTVGGSRETMRDQLLALSLLYDWAYPLISETDKATLRVKMKSLADQCIDYAKDFGPFHNYKFGPLSSVGIAGMVMAGDDPASQTYINWATDRYPDMILALNHFSDGGWHEGYNYAWESPGVGIRYLEAIRTATGFDPFTETNFYKNHGYWYLYGLRPDATFGRGYDGGYPTILDFQRPWFAFMAAKYKDPYIQWFYNNKIAMSKDNPYGALSTMRNKGLYSVGDLLWYDPSLQEAPPTTLNTARYFPILGTAIIRSDWTDNATWIDIRAQNFYGGHAHYDEGAFAIYKKGSLAIDSGLYDVSSDLHHWGYYRRTIAHNALLIYDPNEKTILWRYSPAGDHPDGGQRIPYQSNPATYQEWLNSYNSADYDEQDNITTDRRTSFHTSDWLGFEQANDYVWCKIDVTKAYNSYKTAGVIREYLYYTPSDQLIIFDRINATDASFQKKWLLHSINAPTIITDRQETAPAGINTYQNPSILSVDEGSGRLIVKTILPKDTMVTTVGEGGYEYYYNNQNHFPNRTALNPGEQPESWRLEVSPATQNNTDYFLHVLWPTETTQPPALSSQSIQADSGNMVGAIIPKQNGGVLIMFGSKMDTTPVSTPITYSYDTATASVDKHIITNLKKGARYSVSMSSAGTSQLITITESTSGAYSSSPQGILFFEQTLPAPVIKNISIQ